MKDDGYAPAVAALLALEPEEIAFLLGSKSVTKKVQKIYEEAHSLIEKEVGQEIEVFGGFGAKPELLPETGGEEPEDESEDEQEAEAKKEAKSQSSLFDF